MALKRGAQKAVIGIDVGTSAVKALVVGADGQVLAEGDGPQEVSTPRPGWTEQHPHDWWAGTIAAVRQAMSRVRGVEVAGIGLSGQMHSAVFLDRRGEVIRPALLWNDVRTTAQCRLVMDRVGPAELRRRTGNPALEGFTVTKALWLRDNEPRNFARLATLMLAKDYVRFRLTGELATEPSDAGGTLLFDVARGRWSAEMAEDLDINPAVLPHVIGSAEVAGRLSQVAAAELGLKAGIPVAAGAADNAAAAAGAGVTEPGSLLVSVGTSGTVVAPVARPRPDRGMRVHLMNHAAPGVWYLMGVVLSAGGAFSWFRSALGPKSGPPPAFQALAEEAAGAPPGSAGLVFLPYLSGERTPHADSSARAVFCGLHSGHDRGHLARAVMEGVAYALRDSLELERALGVQARMATIAGGGARSGAWRQIIAEVLGVELLTAGTQGPVAADASHGAPLGAAMLAAVAAGLSPSVAEAGRAWLHETSRTAPQETTKEAYDAGYALYRSLYVRLKQQFREGATATGL
jgi:xylulokinase